MKTYKNLKGLMLLLVILLLAACGGGESGGNTDLKTSEVLSGQVADGYLVNARIFLDRNRNLVLDAGEPSTLSEAQGVFSLEVPTGEGDLYPVVAEIIAGQTTDEDQPSSPVSQSYILVAPAGRWSFISPLTSLIKAELDKNPSFSFTDAEDQVRSQLSLSQSISFETDYVQSQEGSELENARRTAQIVAGLMGNLQAEIEENIGEEPLEKYRIAISYLISDQVMSKSHKISEALSPEGDAETVESITQSILRDIDLSSLDTERLDHYVDLIEQSPPVWDSTSAKIVNKNPVSGGETSVDASITITFDEELDETSVLNDTITLTGSTGPVNGTISYNPDLKQISFVPESNLLAFTFYQVKLNSVDDVYGNRSASPTDWSFTTIFDQQPPDLPDF